MAELHQISAAHNESDDEFETLPEDADEATVARIAERIFPLVRKIREENPWWKDPTVDSPRGADLAKSVMAQAVVEYYNPAQLRVLQRLNSLLEQEP